MMTTPTPACDAESHWEHSTLFPQTLQYPFVLLLIQMMEKDGKIDDREYAHICASIMQRLGMDECGARDLVECVLKPPYQQQQSSAMVSEFHQHASNDQRQQLMKALQQVAIADEELHLLEVEMLNNIAILLGLNCPNLKR